jgi:hypothetical protein
MYPVTHIVLATGAAWGTERVARRLIPANRSRLAPVGPLFDYRFVALGAWLPDIIDKPLGWWILNDPAYEHSFAHSLLFVWILAVPGLFLARRGDMRLLSVAFGDAMHVLFDPVMRTPEIFFWPLWGWQFDSALGYAIEIHIPWRRQEAVSLSIVALVLLWLTYRRRVRALVWQGRL